MGTEALDSTVPPRVSMVMPVHNGARWLADAIASVLVFPKLVFPNLDPLTGTLWSFAIFALAFVARPVGTVIFTAIDRAYGRGAKLTIALFLLGGSTAAIAFLLGRDASFITGEVLHADGGISVKSM